MLEPWDNDPVRLVDAARQDAARVRGWARLGDHERAGTHLDRALAQLQRAEELAQPWLTQAIDTVRRELDAAVEAA